MLHTELSSAGGAHGRNETGWSVLDYYRVFRPEVADMLREEPETVAQVERWADWCERTHGRTPLIGPDGSRVFDALAIGWALEAQTCNHSLELPNG